MRGRGSSTSSFAACIVGVVLALAGAPPGLRAAHGSVVGAVAPSTWLGSVELPLGLREAASATIGAERADFRVERRRGVLVANGGGLSTLFLGSGLSVAADGARVELRVVGVGYGDCLISPIRSLPVAVGNRVSYRRGALTEWYANGPLGLEQGFTLEKRPQGGARGGDWLTVALRVSGPLRLRRAGSDVVFARPDGGAALLRFGGLQALDARGRLLPARLELANRTLLLRVDDTSARYPLTIDPFIQQGPKLTASDGSGPGWFGWGVALSSDGNTAVVGGPWDNGSTGAAWVFLRSGGVWTQQGPKLTASDGSGPGSVGYSVAISGDGNTALVGGPDDNSGVGAAWIFTRSGGVWAQQGSKLTASDGSGPGSVGVGVALSGDGNTALVGGPADNSGVGAAWIFTRSDGVWAQQGSKLTLGDGVGIGFVGASVALSGDGNTALIGGPADNSFIGAAGVFTTSP